MKVVFIGGGAFRTLPVARGALAEKKISHRGEICLYDLNIERAEAMGRMIMKTPEFAGTGCKITWGKSLEASLEGADAVSVVLLAGSPKTFALGYPACHSRGYLATDNTTVNGAFLALKGGRLITGFARKMERICPDAWLMIFANPVAVHSGVVNNHTRIKAMGICAGYQNHMWDLNRLMGRDEHCDQFDVDVAGVNHLSFILRGKYRGRDLYRELSKHTARGLKGGPYNRQIRFVLENMIAMYRRFGVMIFSNELDGAYHLYPEKVFKLLVGNRPASAASVAADLKRSRERRAGDNDEFRAMLNRDLSLKFWDDAARKHHPQFGREDRSITVEILKALAGAGKRKLVFSRPNRSAVPGFKPENVLEYSQYLDRDNCVPAAKLAVPDALHGIIGSISQYQKLLGDSIVSEDPLDLYRALYAYPLAHDSGKYWALCRELLRINREEIPLSFQGAADYF